MTLESIVGKRRRHGALCDPHVDNRGISNVSVKTPAVGLVLGTAIPPEGVCEAAAASERIGFDELWLIQDYFFTGAISAATAALGATERLPVGIGIVSAMVRHPAVLAMEIATVARMYPGAFVPGSGSELPHGLIR